MAKIAVIGICGSSTFLQVDHFHREGETLRADGCFTEYGGKGANQAVAARRMGAEVSFLCAVGDDAEADGCRAFAEKQGIKGIFPVKAGKRTTFAVILTDKHGENRVTVCPGAALDQADAEAFAREIISSDVLLLQNEVPEEVNLTAAEIAVKHGVPVILNPAPAREISDALAKCVYAVTPNRDEREAIDPERFGICITTLGSDGCRIEGGAHIPARKTLAVDTTGAGDTFIGVLAACIAEGMKPEEAARYAVCAAGLSVEKPGVLDAVPERAQIEKAMHA